MENEVLTFAAFLKKDHAETVNEKKELKAFIEGIDKKMEDLDKLNVMLNPEALKELDTRIKRLKNELSTPIDNEIQPTDKETHPI